MGSELFGMGSKQLSELLQITQKTAIEKMKGRSRFTLNELVTISNTTKHLSTETVIATIMERGENNGKENKGKCK